MPRVMDGFNTRFDIYANGNSCPGGDVHCPASINSHEGRHACGRSMRHTGNGCKLKMPANWVTSEQALQADVRNARYPTATTPDIMGHPRDMCHAVAMWGIAVLFRSPDRRWRLGSGRLFPRALTCEHLTSCRGLSGQAGLQRYWRQYGWLASSWQNATEPAIRFMLWEIADHADHRRLGIPAVLPLVVGNPLMTSPSVQYMPRDSSWPYGTGARTTRQLIVAVFRWRCSIVRHLTSTALKPIMPVRRWMDVFLVEPSISRQQRRRRYGGRYQDRNLR